MSLLIMLMIRMSMRMTMMIMMRIETMIIVTYVFEFMDIEPASSFSQNKQGLNLLHTSPP
jgi:hypothetical protein